MNKDTARKIIKEKKALMNKEQVLKQSKAICDLFLTQECYKNATVIYTYLPYNQEIKTQEIIERAWADGKKVAVPKVLENGVMEFYEISSFEEIEPGFCNIPEPVGQAKIVDYKNVLILMPGLAFDKDHNRVGYGGGYYDRYLERYEKQGTKFLKVSLAYDFQIVDELEVESYDEKIDMIITNSLVI